MFGLMPRNHIYGGSAGSAAAYAADELRTVDERGYGEQDDDVGRHTQTRGDGLFGRGACDHERVAVGDHVGDHVAKSAARGVYYDFGLVHSNVFAPDSRSKNVPNAATRKKKWPQGARQEYFLYICRPNQAKTLINFLINVRYSRDRRSAVQG